ncbi:hypothetical protein EAE96_010369 [Botrytis aclada]|nr:hypothetical protein EAE96_010369 [Botrytis aclada]
MSHHTNNSSEPSEYDWTAGIEAMVLTMSALLKDDTCFQRYLYECAIAEEKKGAPLEVEELKAICEKSKDDLERELGVECICRDCWARLQMDGVVDQESKNKEVRKMEVEDKEANGKLGEISNTVAGGAAVSSRGAANEVTDSSTGDNMHSNLSTPNGTSEKNLTK